MDAFLLSLNFEGYFKFKLNCAKALATAREEVKKTPSPEKGFLAKLSQQCLLFFNRRRELTKSSASVRGQLNP